VIEKESFIFKDLEHVGIEKAEQTFSGHALGCPARAWRLGTPTKRPAQGMMHGLGSVHRPAVASARRSFVAQAGLSVEDRGAKLEINQTF
jgi:predicted HD phosphohydrolase